MKLFLLCTIFALVVANVATACSCPNGGTVAATSPRCRCTGCTSPYLEPDCQAKSGANRLLVLVFQNVSWSSAQKVEAFHTRLNIGSSQFFFQSRSPTRERDDPVGNRIHGIFVCRQDELAAVYNLVDTDAAFVSSIRLVSLDPVDQGDSEEGPFYDVGALVFSYDTGFALGDRNLVLEFRIGSLRYLLALIILMILIPVIDGILYKCCCRPTEDQIAEADGNKEHDPTDDGFGVGPSADSMEQSQRSRQVKRDAFGRRISKVNSDGENSGAGVSTSQNPLASAPTSPRNEDSSAGIQPVCSQEEDTGNGQVVSAQNWDEL